LFLFSAVAITFGDRVFKGFAWIVPIGVACSTFGASNGSAFTAARLSYAAASNGHFPRFLSYLRKGIEKYKFLDSGFSEYKKETYFSNEAEIMKDSRP
jgi:amino acid transporter